MGIDETDGGRDATGDGTLVVRPRRRIRRLR